MHGMHFYIYIYMYLFYLADAPATYCKWNKMVYQDRWVVGKKCVLLGPVSLNTLTPGTRIDVATAGPAPTAPINWRNFGKLETSRPAHQCERAPSGPTS